MLDNLRKEFVKTARAKGVREKVVLWRHAFRNALFPLITILGSAFASVLSGAVVIEFVFNIPGMGRLVYDAILDNDWPVIFGVVQLGAFLTILGYLIADFLYAAADPRVKFTKKAS
jgi:peptide/nickel transport system permease protein